MSQLTAEKRVMVRLKRGEYDLRKSIRSYVKYLKDRAEVAHHGGEGLASERERWTRIRADQAADERRVQLGELVPASEIEEAWVAYSDAVRTRLLAVPGKIASR